VADSARGAVDDTYPYFMTAMQTFLRAPAAALPSRGQYEAETAINGALVAGSPEEVAEKIVYQHKLFGHDRFLMQISLGTMPHPEVLRAIDRFGTEVAPIVRSAVPGDGR
jgi:alkanesulfonate monooxygenase SsuD/methylene tetrahydromethanopterin reductase-like flavin-dependent oxidoreductase (luciferase family)